MAEGTDPGRTHRILGREVTVRRTAKRKGMFRLWPLLLLVGLACAALHDMVYRQTGGEDFELGLVSHAALDMIAVVIVLTVVSAIWESRQ